MRFTAEEIEVLRWLDQGAPGETRQIPQRLILRGYVDLDQNFKPRPFLTKRGASSLYYMRRKSSAMDDGSAD